MMKSARHWFGSSLVAAASLALLAACADNTPLSPGKQLASSARFNVVPSGLDNRVPDLTGCEQLAADEGSQLAWKVYGKGVQIYQWDGTAWKFVSPRADLFANADFTGQVGDHFGGPTWRTLGGGTVVGAVDQRCTPDPKSIQWLLLKAVSPTGPGILQGVTQLQRLNTVGGNAPSTPGASVGQVVEVPYTADYLFYRAPLAPTSGS